MATVQQLDMDLLNELFDNQKLLESKSLNDTNLLGDDGMDSLESSISDEDPFLDSALDFGESASGVDEQHNTLDAIDFYSNENLNLELDDDFSEQKSRSLASIAVPVIMEIMAIAYGIIYFS